ncbi:MAG: glycosyltransferase family 4 protein [Opitutaceae bacterium]|nr:glycosyltransferase family 4 protein [Opitutaceae bacterium]
MAVVLSHPIQYYAPWFRRIAAEASLTIRVFYLSDHGIASHQDAQFSRTFSWDTDLLSGYDHEFIPNAARHPDVTRFQGLKNPLLRKALDSFKPDTLLLFGYAYRPHLGLLIRRPAPIIFRGDSHLLGGPPPSKMKRWLLRIIYGRCAAFLPVGRANADYFRHYGVPDGKLFSAPHCVDQSHFTPNAARLAEAAQLRASLHIPSNARVVLFAGKLMPKKRPDLLLAAFIQARTPDAHLVFSGEGELLENLKTVAAGNPHIHFLPFANQSAMPARYFLGDVFVLPSEGRHETWGLATNEAMHLQRPVILSDHVGCHTDLLIPGQTGWLFRAGDQAGLAGALREALSLPREKLTAMGRAAAQHAAAFNYDSATAGLRAAVKSVARTS